jgi:hypothetical protein
LTPNMQKIAEVIADMPGIHGSGTYRVTDKDLAAIDRHSNADSVTCETGSGLSTILFAIIGSRHTAIAPDPEEWERIQEACRRHGISPKNITFLPESSVEALPRMPENGFDLCFIDGCHGFPVAQLDFFYMSRMLKVGGVLGIDDIQIWACQIIEEFLRHEEGWVYLDTGHMAAFFEKKLPNQEAREWNHQPFNIQETRRIEQKYALSNTVETFQTRFNKLMTLIKRGDYATIRAKLQKR